MSNKVVYINSIGIQVGEGNDCIQILMPTSGAIYLHGSFSEMRQFALEIIEEVHRVEKREYNKEQSDQDLAPTFNISKEEVSVREFLTKD